LDDDGAPRVLPVTYAINGETLVTVVDQKPKRRRGESWLVSAGACASDGGAHRRPLRR